jgi:hypothetical protein
MYTIQTSMPRVGFEPTVPSLERAKTVHALDRAATVIGDFNLYWCQIWLFRYRKVATAQNTRLTSLLLTHVLKDHAIAQAVSRWLPTAAVRVRARVWACGICGGQSGARAGFRQVLRFPFPIFIPPIAPQSSSSIIRSLHNRPVVAAVLSELSPLRII